MHSLSTDSESSENDPKRKKAEHEKVDPEMEKYEKDLAVAETASVAKMASIFSKNTKKDTKKKSSSSK